jgi:hypothetical protein
MFRLERSARRSHVRSILTGLLAMAVVAVGAWALWNHINDRAPLVEREQIAHDQREALRSYAARAAYGSLVPQDDALIAVRQEFVQQAIDRSLPYRRYFQDGRYVARLERADVSLDSGLARVTLTGRGMLAGQEQSDAYADFVLRGQIMVMGVDPDSGMLRASVVISDVDTRRAPTSDLRSFINPVARYFGRLKARDWNREGQRLDLPIHINQSFVLPAVDADVRLRESRVPVSVRVAEVTTLDHRMAVSLELLPDSASGERAPPSSWPAMSNPGSRRERRTSPWGRRSTAESIQLMTQVEQLAQGDSLWRSAVATDHDVVVLVPAPLVRTLLTRAARQYLRGVAVDIREPKPIGVDAELKTKILGAKRGVGHFKGTITIDELHGRLTAAGDPRVTLEPPSDIEITMPAQVIGGGGRVTVDMRWDPAKLVGLVCRGFGVNETVEGRILPFRDDLTTRIHYRVLDSTLVGTAQMQRDKIYMPVTLTDSSWEIVHTRLLEQDKIERCGLAMNADSALVRIQRLVTSKGIGVRLPARMFKPFRLPVMLVSRYTAGDYHVEGRTFDPEIQVRPGHLRFAFRAVLKVSATPSAQTRGGPPESGGPPSAAIAPLTRARE